MLRMAVVNPKEDKNRGNYPNKIWIFFSSNKAILVYILEVLHLALRLLAILHEWDNQCLQHCGDTSTFTLS